MRTHIRLRRPEWTLCTILVTVLLSGCGAEEPLCADSSRDNGKRQSAALTDSRVALLADQLTSGAAPERCRAALELSRMGTSAEPAIPALERAMGDSEPEVSMVAGFAVGRLARARVPLALSALVRGLEVDKSRLASIGGISAAGDVARVADSALIRFLDDSFKCDDNVRILVVRALAAIGGDKAIAALCDLFSSGKVELRREAIWGLSGARVCAGIPSEALEVALNDADVDVRAGAAYLNWGVTGVPRPAVDLLIEALREGGMQHRVLAALTEMGPYAAKASVDTVVLLRAPDWGVRAAAATALGRYGCSDAGVVGALTKALHDSADGVGVQFAAIQALGELGPSAASAVPELLRIEERRFRPLIAESLRRMGKSAVPHLQTRLREEGLSNDEISWLERQIGLLR
jgi:HEAT repeat protein